MHYSELVKKQRTQLGLTAKELALALNLGAENEQLIRDWEAGKAEPTQEMLQKLNKLCTEVPFPNISEDECKFTYIDLFAGIGGIRLPFQELGGRCVFSSEWDSQAQKTYRLNYGEQPAGDITKIDETGLPDFDILLGGFPCQPFSQAGLHRGFEDTRGTLFFDIARILKAKRPHAFLLENVKQLQGHDKGRTIQVIRDTLHELNYHVDTKILAATDFGLPQKRERIYIVGFDKEYYEVPEDYLFPYPAPTKIPTKVGDIIDEKVHERYTISDKLLEGFLRRKADHQQKGDGFSYNTVTKDSEYTCTLLARYYKDGKEILLEQGDGKNPRRLTPRECARLQGFPEQFIIPVSDVSAYKQFGNSVAVSVIRAIANVMISEMEKMKKK